MRKLPVTLLCGFPGSGKTALLRRLLAGAQAGQAKIAALVHDFAAVGLDQGPVARAAGGRVALANGCVCCAIQDDLVVALARAAREADAGTRIVVECGGVAHPASLAGLFGHPLAGQMLALDRVVCMVDACLFPDLDYAETELAIDQAAMADLVLLNKADLASGQSLEAIEATLLGAQPAMRIVRCEHGCVPAELIVGPGAAAPLTAAARSAARMA